MNNSEKFKETEKLLWGAYHKLLSVQIEDKEEYEAHKKVLNNINEAYKMLRNNFNTSISGELEQGDNEMINKLTVNNLMQTYYYDGIYELEFHVDDKKFIVTNIFESFHPDAWENEWYFENEETLKEIVMNAHVNDIKEVK